MEAQTQENMGDDLMAECRSFGSNCHPCGQSRKISIGVVVDSFTKTRPNRSREVEEVVPAKEKVTSSKGNSMEDGLKGEGFTVPTVGKQIVDPKLGTSPWVSIRSFNHKKSASLGVHNAKQTSTLTSTIHLHERLNEVREAATTHSVQFFANQMSALQSVDDKQKKFNRVTYRKMEGKDGTAERVEEFSFGTAHEVLVPGKGVVEDETSKTRNMGSETLRMKLWEILGNVSSPNKQFSNSQPLEMDANNLKPEREYKEDGDPVVKPRQNSDTIESDSECPDQIIRRPVTRSLSRKRAPSKVQLNKNKNEPSSSYAQKHVEKNISSFEDGWSGRRYGTANGGSSLLKRKKNERKSSIIEPRRMAFAGQDNAYEVHQTADKNKTIPSAQKLTSFGNRLGGFHSFPSKKTSESVEPKNRTQQKYSHQSPVLKMTDLMGKNISLTFPGNVNQQEELANPSLRNIVDPQYDICSPIFEMRTSTKSAYDSPPNTKQGDLDDHSPAKRGFMMEGIHSFKSANQQEKLANLSSKNIVDPKYDLRSPTSEMRTPIKCSSPDSAPNTNQGDLDDHSPQRTVYTMEGIRSFKSLLNSKPTYYKTNVQMESSDDAGDLEDSPFLKSVPITAGKGTNYRLSKSSSVERDSECSEDSSPIEARILRETESLIGTATKPKFVLRPTKRLRSKEGAEESKQFREPSEQNQEDGLASAVALFALALEKVKSKMNSATSKRSAEILMSVNEGIYLQLQNAESQIQIDMTKLTTFSKLKEKRLEDRFHEQEEQLKVIHERFQEEVNKHLQDCRSTFEGLEAHQIEFKGILEKQKASHRNLLLQAEEAIETQLNDAKKRIIAVHKFARGRMLQLKYVIAECLKEGILN